MARTTPSGSKATKLSCALVLTCSSARNARGVLGVEVAVPGALLDLGLGLHDRLAHLGRDQARQARLVLAQVARGVAQWRGALGIRGTAPGRERTPARSSSASSICRRAESLVFGDHLFGRRVDGLDGHTVPPAVIRRFSARLLPCDFSRRLRIYRCASSRASSDPRAWSPCAVNHTRVPSSPSAPR